MGVGLVRSLQYPDILWIYWRVYNFIANTNKRVLFLPPSDAYVRSFLYLLYTLKNFITQKLWAIQPRLWPRIEFFSSGGQESWHRDSTTTFCREQGIRKVGKCLQTRLSTRAEHSCKRDVLPRILCLFPWEKNISYTQGCFSDSSKGTDPGTKWTLSW